MPISPWTQNLDPLRDLPPGFAGSVALAALPLVALLVAMGAARMPAHRAALLALVLALAIAVGACGMPWRMALTAAGMGAAYGLLPIGWMVLSILFLYRLTVDCGLFARLQAQIAGITPDPRLQLVLVGFGFGAFLEGCAGFGAPVAITGAMLVGLGFGGMDAARLALIANTAPVAFGSLGTPVIALAAASGLPLGPLSAMVGRQLPLFSAILPVWLVVSYAGWQGLRGIWPVLAVAGLAYAIPQALVANLHGPWLVDPVSALTSLGAVILFLRWRGEAQSTPETTLRVWAPWLILTAGVVLWGLPQTKTALDAVFVVQWPVPGLDGLVLRGPPVVPAVRAEPAVFVFNPLSATGTGILASALVSGLVMGMRPARMAAVWLDTLRLARLPLLTLMTMLALGSVTRYAGLDSILGLALAGTGAAYPLFGTLLGWLGVAATGSDTASNVLFGSLQRTSAEQIGLAPTLMAAANTSGGVMGKMIDAQSIVVAAAATGIAGQEGGILRRVLPHSITLAVLVGLWVLAQAYLWPINLTVVQ